MKPNPKSGTCGLCHFNGCEAAATHRYLYTFDPGQGHDVPVHSDLCEEHSKAYSERFKSPAFGAFAGKVVPL
jgi:hypothetical protein